MSHVSLTYCDYMSNDLEIGCEKWFASPEEGKASVKDHWSWALKDFHRNRGKGDFLLFITLNVFHNLKREFNFPHQNVE